MATPVIKTTFEEEQFKKDQAFLNLTGLERSDIARRVRERMKKSNVIIAIMDSGLKSPNCDETF